MKVRLIRLLVGIILTLSAVPIGAHHSWNTFCSDAQPTVPTGTLAKVEQWSRATTTGGRAA